jgi:hypothetical protein
VVKVPKIQLRAEFLVDFDAADFVDAGSHQRRLAEVFAGLQQQYPDAKLSIRERRQRGLKEQEFSPAAVSTGKLKTYR